MYFRHDFDQYAHDRAVEFYRFDPAGPRLGREDAVHRATDEPWQAIKRVEADELAKRQLVKSMHGWQTLHNWIRGRHGLPNRY